MPHHKKIKSVCQKEPYLTKEYFPASFFNKGLLGSILTVLTLQIFAYQAPALNGHDVDRPRNFAKSFAVE